VGWVFSFLFALTQTCEKKARERTSSLQDFRYRLFRRSREPPKSLAIGEKFAATDPQNAQARLDLASGHVDLAEALTGNSDPVSAVGHAQQAITIVTALLSADPTNAV